MNGAHCLTCKEAGPDLVLTPSELGGLPTGIVATIRFTCGRCQQRWVWTVTRLITGRLEYRVQPSASAFEVDVTHEEL